MEVQPTFGNGARVARWPWMLLAMLGCLVGCDHGRPIESVRLASPGFAGMTIAVAPAKNLSGSTDFDPSRFADLMAGALGHAEGILVIPVSRVLGALASQGRETVESPAHALELAGILGADAILVFAVTEYDPYDPPSVGIAAQLYGARPRTGGRALDPVAVSRQAALTASPERRASRGLLAQTQRVFNASHDNVVEEIKRFARRRDANRSAYGWRKYVVSQRDYIRYCCHATLRALLSGPEALALAEGRREP